MNTHSHLLTKLSVPTGKIDAVLDLSLIHIWLLSVRREKTG